MKLPRLLFLFLCLASPGLIAFAGAFKKGAVTVELVPGQPSIQPGRPFWVALKINHDEHWHTYWINAGTGYPTSLAWNLPEGFKTGPIVWPTPHLIKDSRGEVTGLGYDNEVFLLTEITPPSSLTEGSNVTLKAKARWLMCHDTCVPGEAQVELSLPVSSEATNGDTAEARLFAQLKRDLPQPNPDWTAAAASNEKTVTLRLTPKPASVHRPTELHFFDDNGLLDYAARQVIREENGSYVFTLTRSSEASPDINRLTGVLTSANGWSAGGSYSGILIDAPLTSGELPPADSPRSASSAATQPVPPPAQAGLLGTLLLAFVGGLILNLMPCVFPVIGIKILGFVNQSGHDRAKIVAHGLVYTFGVLLSFWILAGTILALRAGGQQIGWGAQLQSPSFVFGMAAFLLIFALNLSGLFEIGLAATGVGGKLQMQSGYGGSFFSGILAVLVSTPCSAPFLAPALGAAFSPTFSAGESMLIFTVIALGLSSPYLLLSIFPDAVKILPRPGAWMETFKQFMAFPLYATIGWLLWVFAAQTAEDYYALLLVLFALVIIAMAGWIYGRFNKPTGRIAAAALFVTGLWLGWPKTDEPRPVTAATYEVQWEKWSPEAIANAQKAGKFVYVDFTARWCATCQTNKAAVFHDDALLAEFAKRNVVLLRGDWTKNDPKITAELARWNRSAVPFNLIYAPGKSEPVVLPELLTPGKVLEALAQSAK